MEDEVATLLVRGGRVFTVAENPPPPPLIPAALLRQSFKVTSYKDCYEDFYSYILERNHRVSNLYKQVN